MNKQLNTRIQYKIDTEEQWDKSTFTSLKGELYFYSTDEQHPNYTRLKIGDGENIVKDLPFLSIGSSSDTPVNPEDPDTPVDPEIKGVFDLPTEVDNQTYTGNQVTPFNGYDFYNYIDTANSSDYQGVNAGTYLAHIVLQDGYKFKYVTTEITYVSEAYIEWQILPAELHISFDKETIIFDQNAEWSYIDVKVDYTLVPGMEHSVVATIPEGYPKLRANLLQTGTIIIWYDGDYNHEDYDVDITFEFTSTDGNYKGDAVLNVKTIKKRALNDYSWEEIANIAISGTASSMFEIGEYKEITLNGTFGNFKAENTKAYAFIIGFNHGYDDDGYIRSANGNVTDFRVNSIKTIDFQISLTKPSAIDGITALTEGTDTYEQLIETPQEGFQFTSYNSDYYIGSHFWDTYLGSFISLDNGFRKLFSSDLQDVIVPIYAQSPGVPSSPSSSAYQTWVNIPSLYEVTTYSADDSYDQTMNAPVYKMSSYVATYKYYENSNSCIDKNHYIWLRPLSANGGPYCINDMYESDGKKFMAKPYNMSLGITPIFRVGEQSEVVGNSNT